MAERITVKTLKQLLELHKIWLESDHKYGKRLDLSHTDLTDLKVAGLLRDADLSHAYLSHANLKFVNLHGVKLCGATLYNANLEYAILTEANLRCANLTCANLHYADLRGADLTQASLNCANLYAASFRDANLEYASVRDALWYGADLNGAKNIPFIRMACPVTGSFIGWKRIDNYIIKLEIPAEAKRCSATTNKCRCEFARVLEIQNVDGSDAYIPGIINCKFHNYCIYEVGKLVYPDKFDENRWNECSNGIHFFINRQEAVEYGRR